MKTNFFLLFTAGLMCVNTPNSNAQAIDNTGAPRNINKDGYVRLSYDNDFFTATDQYYTQGIDLEMVLPGLGKGLLPSVLVKSGNDVRYGVGLQHNGYTPSSISSDAILYKDRPFAGVLMAKAFAISANYDLPYRLSSSMHLGIIGPNAGAQEMQTYIHHELNNLTPRGWEHQIKNDIILNYGVHYEQELFSVNKYLLLAGNAGADLGTLNTSISTGVTFMAGYFSSPFRNTDDTKGLSIYGYMTPTSHIVGYNATLQGGLLNRTSPHTFESADICRLLFRSRFGVVVAYRGIYLEYFQAYSTREFFTGQDYRYGGVQLGIGF